MSEGLSLRAIRESACECLQSAGRLPTRCAQHSAQWCRALVHCGRGAAVESDNSERSNAQRNSDPDGAPASDCGGFECRPSSWSSRGTTAPPSCHSFASGTPACFPCVHRGVLMISLRMLATPSRYEHTSVSEYE